MLKDFVYTLAATHTHVRTNRPEKRLDICTLSNSPLKLRFATELVWPASMVCVPHTGDTHQLVNNVEIGGRTADDRSHPQPPRSVLRHDQRERPFAFQKPCDPSYLNVSHTHTASVTPKRRQNR